MSYLLPCYDSVQETHQEIRKNNNNKDTSYAKKMLFLHKSVFSSQFISVKRGVDTKGSGTQTRLLCKLTTLF